MSTPIKKILITGGAGFIGSHVVKYFVKNYPDYQIYTLDKLTYAGNLENLKSVEAEANHQFIKADIVDFEFLKSFFTQEGISDVIHLAAESHVDRSIHDPSAFIKTNVLGTMNLLLASRDHWKSNFEAHRFYHISTDEVYGSLGDEGFFTETTSYDPRSPYSASKASSDHLVRAFFHTYNFPAVISNCSNNYGPNQFPEKLIPLVINNIVHKKELPIYGKGLNVRDWLWVEDHVRAIDLIFHQGALGETYNIGGNSEKSNIELVEMICELMDQKLNRPLNSSKNLIRYVKDRPGHDHRYAIDASKIKNELSWSPAVNLQDGLSQTIDWYLNNTDWLNHITSGEYMDYYAAHYAE